MKTSAGHALEVESQFLAGAQANITPAQGRIIAGSWFKREDRDEGEAVRAAMVDRRVFDRGRYADMPRGRAIVVKGFERRFLFFGKKTRSVTVASVLAPPGPLLDSDEPAPPVSLSELTAHLRSLVSDVRAPHLIGVCSPSGFTDEVWRTPPELMNVKLVLIEPRAGGGWRVSSAGAKIDERFVKMFDPEGVVHKLDRVKQEIEARSSDLLMGGLSAESLARQMSLPLALVRNVFEMASKADPELRVTRQGVDALLYRGAPVMPGQEDRSMSLAEWIKSLFSKEGEEAKKINVLAERRAALNGRLDRMYDDIGKLEKKEEQLHNEGTAATSSVVKRRMAGQIARLRKDIQRHNTSAAMLSKQINIISTHIHNLELAQTGSIAQLPDSEELTQAAVNAEEMLEQLAASDDLVSGLEVSMAESALSADEAEILRELEGGDRKEAASKAKTGEPSRAAEAPSKQRGPAQAEG